MIYSQQVTDNGVSEVIADHRTDDSPCISVVMAVYNGETYLREAVDSILNQTFTDFEFIIIDDGSTDSTATILDGYTDPRIVRLRNERNLGQGQSRNRGFEIAVGKFVAIQDADDVSLSERLATQVTCLRQNPEIGVLGTAYYRSNPQAELVNRRHPPLTDTGIRWRMLFGTPLCHASIMFRRSLIEEDGLFYRAAPPVEDYEFLTRLLGHTRAANLPVPLYVHRLHSNGTCAIQSEEVLRAVVSISVQQINALLPQNPLTRSEVEALHRCYHSRQLTQQDMSMGLAMFQLFDAFSQQPGVDLDITYAIRRRWIKRVLASVSVRQLRDVWASGLLKSILRCDPMAILIAGLVYLPKRTVRRAGRVLNP